MKSTLSLTSLIIFFAANSLFCNFQSNAEESKPPILKSLRESIPKACEFVLGTAGLVRESVESAKVAFHTYGASRILFAPSNVNPNETPYRGFLTDRAKYEQETWRITRALLYGYHFLGRRAIGLFRAERGRLYDCAHGDPRYVLSISNGLLTCIDRAIYSWTEKQERERPGAWVKPRITSFISKLAFGILVGVATAPISLEAIEWSNARVSTEISQHFVSEYFEDYYDVLSYDPIFSLHRKELLESWPAEQSGQRALIKLTLEDVREIENEMIGFAESYDPSRSTLDEKAVSKLESMRIFEHLRRNSSFTSLPRAEQLRAWKDLASIVWLRIQLTRLAPSLLSNFDETSHAMASNQLLHDMAKDIRNSNFYNSVVELRTNTQSATRLSEKQSIALLRSWISYRSQLAEMEVLKVPLPAGFSMPGLEAELLSEALHNKDQWHLPGDKELWRAAAKSR